MPDLQNGESRNVTSTTPRAGPLRSYTIKNVDGVYSCTCQSWRVQTRHPDFRTCKHIIALRGAPEEARRIAPGGRGLSPSTAALLNPHWPKGKVDPPPKPAPQPKPSVWDRLTGDDPFA